MPTDQGLIDQLPELGMHQAEHERGGAALSSFAASDQKAGQAQVVDPGFATPELQSEKLLYADVEKDAYDSKDDLATTAATVKVSETEELTPEEAFEVNVDGDQSPFPEVAASVPVSDDPSIVINRNSRESPLTWPARC